MNSSNLTSPNSRGLFETSMSVLDQWWDPNASMASIRELGVHDTRTTVYYALGLLMRGTQESYDRALSGLDRVFRLQWIAPGSTWHGSFARHPREFPGPAEKEIWQDFDPNMREFVSMGLTLVLELFSPRLPPDMIARLQGALAASAEGAYERNVPAAYTNAALMNAFLLDYVGSVSGKTEYVDRARALTKEIIRLRQATRVFVEYNSPTYYGVDLCALALWRAYAKSELLRTAGEKLELALWIEMSQVYHPALCNLCGPWLRTYGMDMTRYCSVAGLWLTLATQFGQFPIPNLTAAFDHSWDISFAPLICALGAQVPEQIPLRLNTPITARRLVKRALDTAGTVVSQSLLTPQFMAGCLNSNGTFDPRSMPQAAPLTIHWLSPLGEIGTVRAAPGTCLDAEVTAEGAVALRWFTGGAVCDTPVSFELNSPPRHMRVTAAKWMLPGLQIDVESSQGLQWIMPRDNGMTVAYRKTGTPLSMTLRLSERTQDHSDDPFLPRPVTLQ